MNELKEKFENSLFTALATTMEEMAFQEVENELEDTLNPIDRNHLIWAKMDVNSPFKCTIAMLVDHKLASDLTETIYGSLDPLTDFQVKDALAELLNTIAGCFLGGLLPSHVMFDVSLPSVGIGNLPKLGENELKYRYAVNGCETVIRFGGIVWEEVANSIEGK